MEKNTLDQIQYEEAVKKVKKLKGFYNHALVYVVINIMVIIANVQNYDPGESFFQFKTFMTAFLRGIGLFAHAMGTFVPYLILGKDWEARKIKELMEKEQNVNKWE